MTVIELINLALGDCGDTEPEISMQERAFSKLNLELSTFQWWDEDAQPIYSFSSMEDTINLPPYYCQVFEYLLACRMAPIYGKAVTQIEQMKADAKSMFNHLVYRRQQRNQNIKPTTFVR